MVSDLSVHHSLSCQAIDLYFAGAYLACLSLSISILILIAPGLAHQQQLIRFHAIEDGDMFPFLLIFVILAIMLLNVLTFIMPYSVIIFVLFVFLLISINLVSSPSPAS